MSGAEERPHRGKKPQLDEVPRPKRRRDGGKRRGLPTLVPLRNARFLSVFCRPCGIGSDSLGRTPDLRPGLTYAAASRLGYEWRKLSASPGESRTSGPQRMCAPRKCRGPSDRKGRGPQDDKWVVMRDGNPTSRKGGEKWGTPFRIHTCRSEESCASRTVLLTDGLS